MKYVLIGLVSLMVTQINAQEKTSITINREKSVYMASLGTLGGAYNVFVGEETEFFVLASGRDSLKIYSDNGQMILDSSSMKGTGPITVLLTPERPGKFRISVSCKSKMDREYSLIATEFWAVEKPAPTLWINGRNSGDYLQNLPEDCRIQSFYDDSYASLQRFEVESWKVTVGEKVIEGQGITLNSEAVAAINSAEKEAVIKVSAALKSNEDGFKDIQGIYMTR